MSRRRAGVLCVAFFALFFALLVRLYWIQVEQHDTYAAKRRQQSRGTVTVETMRSPIRDRHGEVLAVSVPMETVWANPSAIDDPVAAARLLSPVLSVPFETLLEKLSRTSREYVVLKRKLAEPEAAAVRRLQSEPVFRIPRKSSEPRLGLVTEFDRRYPHGTLLSHVLGFYSEDPSKHEGLERLLNPHLAGQKRTIEVSLDGRRWVLDTPTVDMMGADVFLTIDLQVQKIVEEEMDALVAEFRPKWASVVVLDPQTGRVLAMTNRPTFDPNNPAAVPAEARKNRAVSDPYEPGSTLKPFHCVYALELGLVRPETMLDCENGLWKHGPRLLHDHHPYGKLSLSDGIKFSSNILAAKVGALILGRRRMHEAMGRFGFGMRSDVDLPAEDDGRLFPLSKWNIYSDTSVPMGHEIAVTPLQLTAAMAAIANGGTLYRPYAVQRIAAPDGAILVENSPHPVRTVIGRKAAREMIEILTGVVDEGTGKKAQVNGVKVAGKTGTTQKIDPVTKKYTHEKFISSFVGFAPAEQARLVVAVVVDEPQGAYYGGAVAAPVVGRIIQRGLVYTK